MRIIHLSAERTWRGGEQQIAYLIEELNLAGLEQLVVCRKNSAFETYCIKNNLPYKSIPFRNQFDISSSLTLKSICRDFNADLIHIHSSHAHAIAVWSYYLGNKTPLVLARKVDFKISSNFLSGIKYNCKAIRKIICVSEAIKKIIQQDIDRPEICEVVYDGIDLAKFDAKKNILREEFSISADTLLIGNTSAIADHKDYPTFIRVAEELRDKLKAKFLIIGDGPLKAEMQDLVASKGLKEQVIFTGFRNDIPAILPELDIFLMTSKTEGLGSSILDAFACKVPVIATKAGGIPELVEHELTGLLANPGDHKMLSEYVFRLAHDEMLRNRLIGNAFEKVKLFDKKITAQKTLAIYEAIFA